MSSQSLPQSSSAAASATGPSGGASSDHQPSVPGTGLRIGGATRYSADDAVTESAPAGAAATDSVTVDSTASVVDTAVADGAETAVLPVDDITSAEQARLEAERAARRQVRVAALAAPSDDAAPVAPPAPVKPVKAVTDRFWGSLGLFGLRVVSAAILFVHGLNGLLNQAPAIELWSNTVLPYPRYIALGVSVAAVAVAILLLFGLLTRLAGLVQLGLMVLILTFVMWGTWSIFEPGGTGFIGEQELLLAAVGLVFLLLGAGGWSLDRAFRKGREREGLGR